MELSDFGATRLAAGKLPAEMLRTLLGSLAISDPAVVVGPEIGEDAAVIDVGGPELLVAKTDPITFAAEGAGRYLVAVNSNDLATMGAEPRWLLVTALLPEGIPAAQARAVFEDLRLACRESGITLVGGHTEMTVGLDRPILVGCLLGTVAREHLVRTSGARPGDALVLAGGVAVEGAAILATEHAGVLRAGGVPEAAVRSAGGWLRAPGISVLPAARVLRTAEGLHAMHDPTEGGVATALHEMAEAAGVGLLVRREAIPVLPECEVICRALGLDPLGLLASGALLAAVAPASASAAIGRLHQSGIAASVIGQATEPSAGRLLVDRGVETPLPAFARDELARWLAAR